MKLLMSIFIAALFSLGASYAHACGVDGVAGKTDRSITISWDVSKCKKNFKKLQICWKRAADSQNVCNSNGKDSTDLTGSYTITGLSAETPYKIKTHWRGKLLWNELTTRIVTTDPSPAAITTTLRYEKESPQRYSVYFFWKNPPSPEPEMSLVLKYWAKVLFGWSAVSYLELAPWYLNIATSEYSWKSPKQFSNNRRYQACIAKKYVGKDDLLCISNVVEWK